MATRRFVLQAGVAVLSIAAGLSARVTGLAAAQSFAVKHTDDEWRKLLTPEQFAVLRQSSTVK